MSPPRAKAALDPGPQARREAVRRLIRTRRVATQEQLRTLLAVEGFAVTQATLSRDLARLGARHVSHPDGGSTYEFEELRAADPNDPLRMTPGIVRAIAPNGSLVVLHTQPGTAAAVARSMDMARLPELLGTIAGDDTVFAAPQKGSTPSRLASTLRKFFERATS